ncbi:MAG: hypothetical protein ACOVOR_03590 [Rhabdochlamydiaceae bacterium]
MHIDHIPTAQESSQWLPQPLQPLQPIDFSPSFWTSKEADEASLRLKKITVPPALDNTQESLFNYWNWIEQSYDNLKKAEDDVYKVQNGFVAQYLGDFFRSLTKTDMIVSDLSCMQKSFISHLKDGLEKTSKKSWQHLDHSNVTPFKSSILAHIFQKELNQIRSHLEQQDVHPVDLEQDIAFLEKLDTVLTDPTLAKEKKSYSLMKESLECRLVTSMTLKKLDTWQNFLEREKLNKKCDPQIFRDIQDVVISYETFVDKHPSVFRTDHGYRAINKDVQRAQNKIRKFKEEIDKHHNMSHTTETTREKAHFDGPFRVVEPEIFVPSSSFLSLDQFVAYLQTHPHVKEIDLREGSSIKMNDSRFLEMIRLMPDLTSIHLSRIPLELRYPNQIPSELNHLIRIEEDFLADKCNTFYLNAIQDQQEPLQVFKMLVEDLGVFDDSLELYGQHNELRKYLNTNSLSDYLEVIDFSKIKSAKVSNEQVLKKVLAEAKNLKELGLDVKGMKDLINGQDILKSFPNLENLEIKGSISFTDEDSLTSHSLKSFKMEETRVSSSDKKRSTFDLSALMSVCHQIEHLQIDSSVNLKSSKDLQAPLKQLSYFMIRQANCQEVHMANILENTPNLVTLDLSHISFLNLYHPPITTIVTKPKRLTIADYQKYKGPVVHKKGLFGSFYLFGEEKIEQTETPIPHLSFDKLTTLNVSNVSKAYIPLSYVLKSAPLLERLVVPHLSYADLDIVIDLQYLKRLKTNQLPQSIQDGLKSHRPDVSVRVGDEEI